MAEVQSYKTLLRSDRVGRKQRLAGKAIVTRTCTRSSFPRNDIDKAFSHSFKECRTSTNLFSEHTLLTFYLISIKVLFTYLSKATTVVCRLQLWIDIRAAVP